MPYMEMVFSEAINYLINKHCEKLVCVIIYSIVNWVKKTQTGQS